MTSGEAEEYVNKCDNHIKTESICHIASSAAPIYTTKIICDTGATNTFFKNNHKPYLQNVKKLSNGPTAALPNNTRINASHEGTLNLHPKLKLKTLIFPNLKNESLLSIGQLCDQNCRAIFDKYKMHILKDNQIILQGDRDGTDGLWKINLNRFR